MFAVIERVQRVSPFGSKKCWISREKVAFFDNEEDAKDFIESSFRMKNEVCLAVLDELNRMLEISYNPSIAEDIETMKKVKELYREGKDMFRVDTKEKGVIKTVETVYEVQQVLENAGIEWELCLN